MGSSPRASGGRETFALRQVGLELSLGFGYVVAQRRDGRIYLALQAHHLLADVLERL